jgi:nucleoid DNA-binding protein
MVKVMKTKAVKAMPKSGIAEALATKTGLQKKEVAGVMVELTALATTEVKKTGKFTLPGLCMLKTRTKPARKAGTTTAFGKTIKVKARPAMKIVKAYCVSALKKSI